MAVQLLEDLFESKEKGPQIVTGSLTLCRQDFNSYRVAAACLAQMQGFLDVPTLTAAFRMVKGLSERHAAIVAQLVMAHSAVIRHIPDPLPGEEPKPSKRCKLVLVEDSV